MLENLSQKLTKIIKTVKGEARLTEKNTADMLREIRMALLEADVALPVVKQLVQTIKEQALGQDVLLSLSPGQALVGIVEKAMIDVMSGDHHLQLQAKPPVVILLAGLQGSGKTTTCGKLARYLIMQHKKKVMMASCDVYRPAAMQQLHTLAKAVNTTYFDAATPQQSPLEIAQNALHYAKTHYMDILLVDTAGRLGIDTALMQELKELHAHLQPTETLFVVDAMQGQDALITAQAFHDAVPITGIILSKTDGDSRGGSALSVKHITQKPIKFIGTSEKIDGLQAFDATRMVQRILGMGDILALVEQAHQAIDEAQAQKMVDKLKKGERFDLNDFLQHLESMQKMGGLGNLLDKLPSDMTQKLGAKDTDKMEADVRRMRGIIHSMTPKERAHPDILKATRKRRIALGAGVQVQEVNRLLKQFDGLQGMMKQLKGGGMMKMMRAMGGMQSLKQKFLGK